MGKPSRRASRRDRARPPRRRSGPQTLDLSIVTYPDGSGNDGPYSLRKDIELVRSALLYADHIELVSLRTVMIGSALQFGVASESDIVDVLLSLDDATLQFMNSGAEIDPNFRSTLATLSSAMRLPRGLDASLDEATDLMRETLAPTMAQFRSVAEEMFEGSQLAEILPAFEAGIVELSRSGITDDADTDQSIANWVEIVKARLRDPTKRVLLDDEVGDLVSAMVNEGHVALPDLGLRHIGEASIGSGLVARLPAFPQAPTDELLGLRDDLKSPLIRYRAEVAKMARELGNPLASGVARRADLDQLWTERVEPALLELREGLAEHSLVRELAHSAGREVQTVIKIGTGASVFVGFEALTSLNSWVAAAAAAGPPLASIAGSAVTSRSDSRRKFEKHELFYLYETDRRLRDA